ncbi:MAG: hypothetical protein AAF215_31460 [Cyanobacteria bacterium P01_A01_bin.123]
MASPAQIKQYLAYWFQLGKRIIVNNQQPQLPLPIFQGHDYSPAFEICWQQIMANGGKNSYLEGTDQTIADLLQPAWDFSNCARCEMPVPMAIADYGETLCPCNDLPTWPNTEIPRPRSPVDTQSHLTSIQKRLINANRVGADES